MPGKPEPKLHYYLVSGEILYKHPQAEEAIGTIRLNTMLQLERNVVRHRELGKAQQMLQMHFFNRMNDPLFEIIDVFLYGVSYLGHMTDGEFQLAPEGEQAKVAAPTMIDRNLQ